ncbi:MAG: O-acetylhomoserine aminocarboxypropyltransferase/cysteine synthase [Spirochaetota bacterium]|jgi:O-acetylhomoserine (thiol)-lyase|nr:O-acetylhomoserine aminocarboxypropyltransferase/cysteine synthase [Spirochaetota bacterium]
MRDWRIETRCLQEGWKPKSGEPRVLPIYQSTTYKYDSTEDVAKLFDLSAPGHMYSRISNPTVECLENKLASLEGGTGALCAASGQTATLITVLNLCRTGDHIVSASAIYGGTFNLLHHTLERLGISTSFIDADASEDEIQKAFRPNTRALFGETLANPKLSVLDIEKFARIARANNVPFVIDNTFATPILCRPLEYGADIIVHSATKYLDGHATSVSGVIIESGKFDWSNGNFPAFTAPDESYHGVVYTRDFPRTPFTTKARVQLMRDLGANMTAQTAFLVNLGVETLHLRMERHSANARQAAEYLAKHPKVLSVAYPGLPADKYYALAQKYLPLGASGIISFVIKGGREAAVRFMDSLRLAAIVVHVADARTSVLHPASSTHRQMNDAQLAQAGIEPGMIRLSIGLENIGDIIEDIQAALG